jgi:hypothetical protein
LKKHFTVLLQGRANRVSVARFYSQKLSWDLEYKLIATQDTADSMLNQHVKVGLTELTNSIPGC